MNQSPTTPMKTVPSRQASVQSSGLSVGRALWFQQSGFTLVELIIVMVLLAIVAALSIPSLAGSLRQRNLKEEAARFLAATEYARDEAVSQGVPMTVWVDPTTQNFGVDPKAGYDSAEGRSREFTVNPDIHFEIEGAVTTRGELQAVEFAADGAPSTTSVAEVRLVDRFGSAVSVVRTNDNWGYEIPKETK